MPNYEKLRPITDDEVCGCANISDLLLVYTLTDNPIHCFKCKGEVDPERLGLSEERVEQVFTWLRKIRALYDLWLDSGEYESWAKSQLIDPSGQVNLEGLSIAANFSQHWATYYWWFHDEEDLVPVACPNCEQPLIPSQRHGHGLCHECHVVI